MITMAGPISILLVDDHETIRNGMRSYFETLPDFDVVGEAASGEDALKLVTELIPDIVLMELIMPSMDGIETIRRLKHISPRTQIIILTSCYDDAYVFPAIEAGAASYNLKNMKMERLANELRCAYLGELKLHPLVAALTLQKIRDENGGKSPRIVELTDREQVVLSLIANGLNNSQVAEALIANETVVNSLVSNILSKLYLAGCLRIAVVRAGQ